MQNMRSTSVSADKNAYVSAEFFCVCVFALYPNVRLYCRRLHDSYDFRTVMVYIGDLR